MSFTTLISPEDLVNNLNQSNWFIFDTRFNLADTQAGATAYRHGHIANARYAHLDRDLSSAINAFSGRHPLPEFNTLIHKLGAWGVSNSSQIVIYDDASGAIAGRFWWLLRYLGHENVAVLDGGLARWQKQGGPITTHLPKPTPTTYRPNINGSMLVNAQTLEQELAKNSISLIDARAAERFQGKVEPLDSVAGHIPKALNRPFQLNLDAQGRFLPAAELQQQFRALIGTTPATQAVHMCGSGVTACHNLLAMEIAGLTGSKLYAGSWSEWIRNKNRTIASDHRQRHQAS
ncbi:MAG: sulfurtransferase [Methyloprofundus sp.]|nr:sulfurtransferase [Methyloprofundus sp.]MDT8426451.1 sulfurtransferase [Methyloprofundus sp.]